MTDPLELAWTAFAYEHPDIASRDIANKAVFFAGFKAGVDQATDMFHEVLRQLTIQMERPTKPTLTIGDNEHD